MADLPLIGGHGSGLSDKADSETAVNLFIEPDSTGEGAYLVNRPGYVQFGGGSAFDAATSATISQLAGVATAVVSAFHGYETGDTVTVSGAAEAGYNLTAVITRTTSTAFTYAVAPATPTPATGAPIVVLANSGNEYQKEVRAIIRAVNTTPVPVMIVVVGNRIFTVSYLGGWSFNPAWPRFETLYGPIAYDTLGEQADDGWILSDAVSAVMEGETPTTIHQNAGSFVATLTKFSNTVTSMDGRIIRDDIATDGQFIYSDLFNVNVENAFNFANAEGAPDKLTAVLSVSRNLFLFGEYTTEIFYNTGDDNQPFLRGQGGFFETGIAAPLTAKPFDGGVAWLGQDKRGGLTVMYAVAGASPKMISTPQINKLLQDTAEYVLNCYALVIRFNGHEFYCLSNPGVSSQLDNPINHPKVTLVFDSVTKEWFRWQSSFDPVWMVQAHAYMYDFQGTTYGRTFGGTTYPFKNVHLVGGNDGTGKLYTLSLDEFTDDGVAIDCERTLPPVTGKNYRTVNAGPVELVTDHYPTGIMATVNLSYAKDQRTTVGSEFVTPIPRTATATSSRFRWHRLGRAQRWIFRVTQSTAAFRPVRWLRMVSRGLGE